MNRINKAPAKPNVELHRYPLASGEVGYDLVWRRVDGRLKLLSLGAIAHTHAAQLRAQLQESLSRTGGGSVPGERSCEELTLSMLMIGLRARRDPRGSVRGLEGHLKVLRELIRQEGDLPLYMMSQRRLASHLRGVEYRRGPRAARDAVEQFDVIFQRARDWGWMEANPAERLADAAAQEPQRVRFLSQEQVEQLRAALRGRVEADVVDFMLLTGCRPGEAFSLMGQDVNLAQQQIVFQLWRNKSLRSRRFPYGRSKPLIALLEKLSPKAGNPLFSDPPGGSRRIDPAVVRRTVASALKPLGVESGSLQVFRHTFASHLVMQGVPLFTVSRLLGHRSVETTERHYAHLSDEHLAQAVRKLPYLKRVTS